MRKRAQIKSKPVTYEPKHVTVAKPKFEEKTSSIRKNWWIAVALIAIFFLVLFFNTYFNMTSEIAILEDGEGYSKYLLSGPDPYYNLRLVNKTLDNGVYPFFSDRDTLLNYPLTAGGGRAPLLNMIAIGFSNFLYPFTESEVDAVGISMQFVPALFGALLVFPVFFIGKTLFNKKVGLIAAFFIAIIPIHIGSGHGSAYSLFDHDSLNLLLFFLTFLFFVWSIKQKDRNKTILYGILAGVPLAGLSMVWVEAQFLYVVIAVYTIAQMIIDIFSNKVEQRVFLATSTTMISGYLISLPVLFTRIGFNFSISLAMVAVVVGFGLLYYYSGRIKMPWTLTLPTVFVVGGVGLAILYFIQDAIVSISFLSPLKKLSEVIFGTGIYGKKVSMTIAEANTYQISYTVMSLGPAIYWLGWAGFIFLLWYFYREKLRRDYLFFIILFIVDLWLTATAGRFLNDMVPLIAIFAGFVTWYFVSKLDYKQMIRNVSSAGGGFRGLRRGVKIIHLFGIFLIAFVVILPSVFVTFDAAIPNKISVDEEGNQILLKQEMFGEDYSGAFGLQLYKESYWADAFDWLSKQDIKNSNGKLLEPEEKPAFISWWDYGFYEVALGAHPTVADNFQDGIPPASNFHTAVSEKDAVAVWIVRLLEGDYNDNGKISDEVRLVLVRYLGKENAEKVITWIENKDGLDSSYGTWIEEAYNEYMRDEIDKNLLTVGAQWAPNADYHDVVDLFNNGAFPDNQTGLSEEKVTKLYHDLQDTTGYSIRYYGVEGYDSQIFNIFAFLSDKSLVLLGAPDDEFVDVYYSGYEVISQNPLQTRDITNQPLKEYLEMEDNEKKYIVPQSTSYAYKDAYFNTMFYRTYIGEYSEDFTTGQKTQANFQVPCLDMKHFYAEFISDLSKYQYRQGQGAVVIAKYYEGAFINGTVYFNGEPVNSNISVAIVNNLSYTQDLTIPIYQDRYDIIKNSADNNASFSVIAGADSYVSVIRNNEIRNYDRLITPFAIKNVYFGDSEDQNLTSITDDDAMRIPGSNFERNLEINIEPGTIEGHIYVDVDDNGKYNASIDTAVDGAEIRLFEINEFLRESLYQNPPSLNANIDETIFANSTFTDEDGYYKITGLFPGYYAIQGYVDDYIIINNISGISEGKNVYNYNKPKESDLEGFVYYDTNDNSEYDVGVDEKVTDAEIQLNYLVSESSSIPVETTTSGANGEYTFLNLTPGAYSITATASYYQKTEDVAISRENTTIRFNVSMDFIPVSLTGLTVDNKSSEPVQEALIAFEVDQSVKGNTAVDNSAITDANGGYSVGLQPGSYNVTITKYDGSTPMYLDSEKISLEKGAGSATKTFVLNKLSVTVSGQTTYLNSPVDNVSIDFIPYRNVQSDENGEYTIELSEGTYTVNVTDFESGGEYYQMDDQTLTLTENDISNGKTLNIALDRK